MIAALPYRLFINVEEHAMIKRLAVAAIAVVAIYSAVPASAEEVGVGVGVGPAGVGVTVGSGRSDYDRDRVHERTIIREREPRRDETVIIKKDRDRDWDRGERKVIIDR
ncbi:MAG TPA: hypothetical protein VGO01_04975 [Bradyrhizobium sp.]|nr:hypothetical protein [Bradyrhizobium sp.]